MTEYEGFISSLQKLNNSLSEDFIKLLNGRELQSESNGYEIMQKLRLWILDPILTEVIGHYFRSYLLEILAGSSNLIGAPRSPGSFDAEAHATFCVCLSKLLYISNDVKKFALIYFKKSPSPFILFSQKIEDRGSLTKKLKKSYQIPQVNEIEVLRATLTFLNTYGPNEFKNWDCSGLLKFLDHINEEVRWLSCNALAMLSKMSEYQLKSLLKKYSLREFQNTMIVKTNFFTKHIHLEKETKLEYAAEEYTFKVGKVHLPLFNKNTVSEGGLIELNSTLENLEAIALAIRSDCPVLVEGVVGSGKTSLLEHLANITGRSKAPELSKVQLSDQTDSKTLIGTYRCTPNPGEFIWQAGSLTQAVMEGHWLLLEDIDFAPMDVISLLIPVLESRSLPVPGHGHVRAHPNFQLFATRRILPAGCRMRIGSAKLIENLWTKVTLKNLSPEEIKELISIKWPELSSVAEKLVEVYIALSYGLHGNHKPFEGCQQCGSLDWTSAKASGRFVSLRDLMKWCLRMVSHIDEKDLHLRAFQEALDCFCAAVPNLEKRYLFALHIGSHLNMNEPTVHHYFYMYKPTVSEQSLSMFCIGSRGQLPIKLKNSFSLKGISKSLFSKTRLSSCLLEKTTVAVMNNESILIVGETGTGKTSTVQYLAQQTNHVLKVVNMNQQSDSTDLLGGFKPVEIRTVVSPIRQAFENLFSQTFSVKENSKFLNHIMTTFLNCNWKVLLSLMNEVSKKGCKKLNKDITAKVDKVFKKETNALINKWEEFRFQLKTIRDQVDKGQNALSFSFIEGTLVKAIREGEWVLLDEINLASADTLECLSGLLESSSGSVTLHERGDCKPILRNPEFRLFSCMNPATDVGKKELPAGLRNRFTEFFMEEFQDKEDLMQLVRDYLKEHNPSPKQIEGIVIFYKNVRDLSASHLTDGTGHKPHFSLRTLCRALVVARRNPCKNFQRSLYEAFCLSFLTQLDRSSYPVVTDLIKEKILGKKLSKSKSKDGLGGMIPCPGKEIDFVHVEGYWVSKGNEEPITPNKYIVTESVRSNLHDLVRIVSIGQFPILLQGDTSVGKTSLISYLAHLTGNACVRINNHQHTDLQEYIGSYAPDESGKLIFKEGVLVQAMRNGHWIILDELNLAPTDVLEALNRLLDDNRELFIPEIEITVKAHPKFMLFATQNPPGLYGGRQVLSRAFRNRFVELHFDLIPSLELVDILFERCEISKSHCKKMISVLEDLQNMRRDSNIFQGKQSFITLRDLFRWAERYRLAKKQDTTFYDWDQHIADEGYLVLAGRMRLEKEAEEIRKVLEKRFGRRVDPNKLFVLSSETSSVTRPFLEKLSLVKGFQHVIWTLDMRRLYVLVSKALSFSEPILLVGDTGCGKTTVCQMIAALKEQDLFTVNCHMHSEGADFLGGLRPVRDRASANDNRLFEWVDGPLIEAMKSGGMFLADEISLADDSVLERLNSLLEPERTLVLSEKGSSDENGKSESPDIIIAHDLFRLIGTMNPGGDYGKKELSPALRNRLTEIWCPKVDINRSKEDIKQIIDHNLHPFPLADNEYSISLAMLNFLCHFSETSLGKKCTISIRDVLSWVSFINKVMKNNHEMDLGLAYIHGAYLVLLDSLGSGTTGSTVLNWRQMKDSYLKYLEYQATKLSLKKPDTTTLNEDAVKELNFVNDKSVFGIIPFTIPKGNVISNSPLQFSFEAPRTCLNLLRLLRGLQLPRPILLEGSPGVGKTSLVVALARASGNEIVRINLSEQTDVSDLFGADLPEEGSEGGKFAWRDGPLLQALKSGSWVVLDELNLASQSVLEGLNACFDHRGEVFVPELNKTFEVKHNLTKIFACQNPQYQGGARKGLPKSFLNRFTQVYMESLSSNDLTFILKMVHSTIPLEIISKMVDFNETLVQEVHKDKLWGNSGGPWEFNLRDTFRWCEIMLKNQHHNKLNPGEFVEIIYADRMRKEEDKEKVLDVYKKIFGEEFPLYKKSGKFYINEKTIQVGRSFIEKNLNGDDRNHQNKYELFVLHNQTPFMESVINCINMNWMTILVGESGEGKTSLVHLLANLMGKQLETLSVNSQMDVTELLGGFEQADYGRQLNEVIEKLENLIWGEVRHMLLEQNLDITNEILQSWKCVLDVRDFNKKRTTSEEAEHFLDVSSSIINMIDFLNMRCPTLDMKVLRRSCQTLIEKVSAAGTVSGGGTFEWIDSSLVKAVQNGHWLLIDGVNLCSPSVLDRLNGLLEPCGVLTINERGVINGDVPTIKPHPDFRIFLTMDPQQGEISRAMRNRGLEICMTSMWGKNMDISALMLSRGLEDITHQKLLIRAHFCVCEALPGYEKLTISSVCQAASLMKQLLQLGQGTYNALQQSLNLTYERNFGGKTHRKAVKVAIKNFLKEIDKKSLKKPSVCPPVTKLVVGTHTMQSDSNAAYPNQIVSLIESIVMAINNKISPSVLSSIPMPFVLPSSPDSLVTALFIGLASSSPSQWNLLLTWAKLSKDSIVAKAIQTVCSSPSDCFRRIQELCDKELPSDPRFNEVLLTLASSSNENNLINLSNKALIGLWCDIRREFKKFCISKKQQKRLEKGKKPRKNILELSKAICVGSVSRKMIYHSSLKHIYPLLSNISKLITALANNIEIPLIDKEYFKFREALLWRDRLENLCQQIVTKEAFHIFLPQLVFHWQQLHERLLDNFPLQWQPILSEELLHVIGQLKSDFNSYCTPLHQIVPLFRTYLGYPLPFVDESAANLHLNIMRIATTLTPFYENNAINTLVASEAGCKAKHSLFSIAIDSCKEQMNFEELSTQLQDINESIACELSRPDTNVDKELSTIQLWPIIDLLVSKQLNFTDAKLASSKVSLQECEDALVRCSHIPLECINSSDSSGRLASVSIYLYNVNNCATRRPSRWFNYDSTQNETKKDVETQAFWNGEENTILSSMGCLLTYLLLTGFCKPDQEIEEISVGRHTERVKQLSCVRATLLRNWDYLSDTNSYENSFNTAIAKFVSDLFSSLMLTLKVSDIDHSSDNYLDQLKVVDTLLDNNSHLLGTEGTKLLKLLSKQREILEVSNKNEIEFAKLGIYTGLFQSWLLSHTEPLDPAQQRNLLLSYHVKELEVVEDMLVIHKWSELLRYNQCAEQGHPHTVVYADKLNDIKREVKSLSNVIAYRPEPSQYVLIAQEIFHFSNSVFLPSRITDMINSLESSSGNKLSTILQQCEGTLLSCDNFIQNIFSRYPLYRDLYIPLLHGVCFTCECIRGLMVLYRHRDLCVSAKSNLTETVSTLLSFPSVRDNANPSKVLKDTFEAQRCLSNFLKANSLNRNFDNLSRSLSLRASIYDLYNFAVTETSIDETVFHLLSNLTSKVIEWWKEQEEAKKKKAEEEASLFRYKARTLAISETEEEEIEREYKELFPDYDEEFKDLDNMGLDDDIMDTDEDNGKEDQNEDVPKLTDDHLQELIECYRMLSTSLTKVPWLSSNNDLELKIVTPTILRLQQLQLLMRTVGPLINHKIDAVALGAFIISNHVNSSTLKKTTDLSLIKKPYNYYYDAVPEESLKIRHLLQNLEMKINSLLKTWPSHPSLLLINKVIHRVLDFPITSPLIRFVIGLETILEKSHEWEKNAHKGVSLMAEISPITSQILEWRKMELNAWKSCLEMITYKISVEAHKYWPHLYESFTTIALEDVNDLIQPLKQFMEGACIGDYEKRHQLMFSFHCHLTLVSKYCKDSDKKAVFDKLVCITWNFYKYYGQFLPLIQNTITKSMKPIEKQVKDFIKIMRWNDINFFAVKDSVIKSRRTLHRHMRNWEKVLRQPSASLLTDTKAGSDIETTGEWDKSKDLLAIKSISVFYPVFLEVDPINGVSTDSLVSRLPLLTKKCSSFVETILKNNSYISHSESIEDMTEEIILTYQDLGNANTKAEAITDKDDRKRQFKALMHHKRECLATLFKKLIHKGVSYTKGNNIFKDDDLDKCLRVHPIDIRLSHSENKNLQITCLAWESCEKYYYKCIGRHALLSSALNQAHADLGPELTKRVKGSSCHLLLHARKLRETLPILSTATSDIISMVNEITKASKKMFPNAKDLGSWWSKVNSFVISLSLSLSEEKKIMEALSDTEAEPIIVIQPALPPLSALQIQEILSSFEEIHVELRKITFITSQNNQDFNNEQSCKLASEDNILELNGVIDQISFISQKVAILVSTVTSASLHDTNMSRSLKQWVNSWEATESEFEDWKLTLLPCEESSYFVSENVETCITKVLLGIEILYKNYSSVESNAKREEEIGKLMISEGMVNSLLGDVQKLRLTDVKVALSSLIADLRDNKNLSVLIALKAMTPLLLQYIVMCENLLAFTVACSRSINKLLSVLLAVYQQLSMKGFCRPQDIEEEGDGEGATQFEDSGPGLTEGEGQKDVSDRFESEDQLESALQEGQKEQAGDKDLAEEDGGIEMSTDFEGNLQNVERKEEEDDKKNDDNSDEDDFDKEMGETEKGADKIDEKLWGEEEDNKNDEDGPEKEEEEEHGPGDGETTESELVAKDDNKSKKEVDNAEQKKKKELEVMEEDRREPNEEDEEEPYDDKYKDKFGGENQMEDKEEEQMDLPDDLNLDNQEKDDGSGDEGDPGINPEIEEKPLFPEEERELKDKEGQDKNEETEEGEEKNEEPIDGPDENHEQEEIEDGDETRKDKTRMETEAGDPEEDNIGEEPNDEATPSQDSEAKEAAQAADSNTKDASKDKTKDIPTTATGAQLEEDEEFKQDEQGEMGEQTEDMTGVGQSDSKTREDSHKGKTSALTNEQQAEQKRDEENRPRKPGDIDISKTLGDVEKEIHHGLMTKKTSGAKEEEQDKLEKENADKKDTESKDANMYEHLGLADDHYDKQTTDAGTQEEAKLRPAPLEEGDEEDNEEEAKGIEDTLMDVEEPAEETQVEETKKRQADMDGKDGPLEKRSRVDPEGEGDTEHQLETEGEIIKEMMVSRGPQNEFHTILNEDEVVAAIFNQDINGVIERIEEAGDGDVESGSNHWSGMEGKITPLALQLCEQLRLILEPTEASKLRGDFRTGKRLNMRKVIPYIASQFRKDKIWLRRTQPNKRSYQVLLAVDDSESMKEVKADDLARESVALVAKALTLLEVGQVGVLSFGTDTKILHPLNKPFSDQTGARIFANLKFDQSRTNFAKMIEDSVALLSGSRGGGGARPDIAQLLLIVSDGQTHARSKAVKAAVRAAREARVFVVFLVLDAFDNTYSFYDALVCDENGQTKPLVETFPFPFFLVIRDLQGLPDAIAAALRQWFELVTADAH